jgi:nitrate reductase NapE component
MSLLASVVVVAAATAEPEALAPLIFPSWLFPLIAVAIFLALGLIVWSYRDVANRHSDRVARAAERADATHGTIHH